MSTPEKYEPPTYPQLARLARPFPKGMIHEAPKGKYGSYVKHSDVNQKLLAVLGPFSFEVVEIVRAEDENGETRIEGCLARLTCTIDGREVSVTEVGDCDNPGNWKTDGARLKDAASDAFKRAAMRLGAGLHLWCQGSYVLPALLKGDEKVEESVQGVPDDPERPFE